MYIITQKAAIALEQLTTHPDEWADTNDWCICRYTVEIHLKGHTE